MSFNFNVIDRTFDLEILNRQSDRNKLLNMENSTSKIDCEKTLDILLFYV